jgi:hypothetical protein
MRRWSVLEWLILITMAVVIVVLLWPLPRS